MSLWNVGARLIVLLLAGAVAACGTMGAPVQVSSRAAPTLTAQDYALGPGDKLRVNVFGQPTLTGEFDVGVNGDVMYPLVGAIPASGKTVSQFGQDVSARLAEGFVREPNVTVQVATYRPFYILGEVTRPGTYPFSAELNVMRAVATAGGFTYRANSRRVYIQHSGENIEREYTLTTAISLRPGDTVRIPERRF